MTGIWNLSSTDKESEIQSGESRIQDFLGFPYMRQIYMYSRHTTSPSRDKHAGSKIR